MTCSTPGCDRPIKGHGLCSTHHRAALRNGTITPRRVANQDPCPVDGCGRTVRTKGMCQRHYAQQWNQQQAARRPKPKPKPKPAPKPQPAPMPAPERRANSGGSCFTSISDVIVLSRPHDQATLDRARRCLQRHDALDLAAMLGLEAS